MTWFKVDDKAHANTKIRKVLAEEPAALALWLVAGSWVADELNDGFVPDTQLPWLMPAGADVLAQKLVAARLWRRVRGGYEFHEWHKDGDGTKRNPTREEVLTERQRKVEAGRKGGIARAENYKRGGNKKKVHANEDSSSRRRAEYQHGYEQSLETDIGPPDQAFPSSRSQAGAKAEVQARAKAGAEGLLQPPSRPSPSKEGRGEERAPATRGAAHAPPEDPRVVAQAEEELRLKAEAAVAAIAEHQARTTRGAAAARAAIPKRARHDPGTSALDRLTAAVADLPPLTQSPPDDPDPPLAEVVPLRPAALAEANHQPQEHA